MDRIASAAISKFFAAFRPSSMRGCDIFAPVAAIALVELVAEHRCRLLCSASGSSAIKVIEKYEKEKWVYSRCTGQTRQRRRRRRKRMQTIGFPL